MSQLRLEHAALRTGGQQWRALQELMATTSRDLEGAPVAGLPPAVQPAGTTFLSRWAGYAGQSAEIAGGFAGALAAAQDDFLRTEDATDRRFSDLDGRLGSAR